MDVGEFKFCVLFVLGLALLQAYDADGKKADNRLNEVISDIKDFKRILRTKTNVLVLFANNANNAANVLNVFANVADVIKGEGTSVFVDCSNAKKLCKKLKISPETYILKHYKDGEFNKDYDRKETVQSMVTFMRNPTGDMPWEEESTAADVFHLSDPPALEKLLTKETKPILVMFYVPWCGFCKKLKPDFAQAATELKRQAVLAGMDVNNPENGVIRHHFNITGFPTLIYFENGKFRQIYDGDNNKEGIVHFIKNPYQPKEKSKETEWQDIVSDVVHLTDSSFEELIAKESSVLVMLYAPWCGHCKAMKPDYVEAAAKLKTDKIPGVLAAVDATKETQIASKLGVKGYPTVKYFKDGQFAFDVSFRTADKIIEFMKDPKEPPPPPPPEKPWHETESSVHHLDETTFKSLLKKKKHALVMFYAPWCGHCKRAKPEFEDAAGQLQDDLQVAFAAVDCTTHTALCNAYNVRGFPSIKYFNYLKNETEYSGDRTSESFVNFMKDPAHPSAVPKEPSPAEFWSSLPGGDALTHLTSDNFQDFVKDKHVLVMFYAPWCGHCKAMKPAYAEAASILKKENIDAALATVDATLNAKLLDTFTVKGYPTLKYLR
ncbi:hypothetical protein CHUAL_000887 [Chamberlinius hualienensis]